MTVYNNSLKPIIKEQGMVLPFSQTPLSANDVDQKISKTKNHIAHLSGSLGNDKNTHRGKTYRTKQISKHHQIQIAKDRLETLNQAKSLLPQTLPQQEILKQKAPILSEKKIANPEDPILEQIAEELLDPISFELMDQAVALHPCGHTLHQQTLEHIKKIGGNLLCPSCRTPIERESKDHIVQNVVKHYQTLPKSEALQKIKEELLDPVTKLPMTNAVILSPCGHTVDLTKNLGKHHLNACHQCSAEIDLYSPHYTFKNLTAICNPKSEVKAADPSSLKSIVDTLTQEDFDLLAGHVGKIFASSIKMPAPRTTLNAHYYNDNGELDTSRHSYPPTLYHRIISTVLSYNLQKELKAGNVIPRFSQSVFLNSLKNSEYLKLADNIKPYTPDLEIQVALDPKRNAHAKAKEDLIFSISFEKDGVKKIKSFALKDLQSHFPARSLY